MFNSYQNIQGTNKQVLVARVKKIVLGPYLTDTTPDPDYTCEKDLGSIRYEILYSGKMNTRVNKNAKLAYPIFGFLRQYPVLGEIVLLVQGPSANLNDSSDLQDLYYFPPFSIFNSVHLNPFPNMEEYASFISNAQSNSDTIPNDLSSFKLPVGATFVEKENVKNIRPFEGDTIIQGRWGQSIRFGSTVPALKSLNPWSIGSDPIQSSGDPITMIVNSQRKYISETEKNSPTTVENINRDGSSIYLTSTQGIIMTDIDTFEIRSWKLSSAVNPNINVTIIPETIPISNELVSPADQDNISLNSSTKSNANQSS